MYQTSNLSWFTVAWMPLCVSVSLTIAPAVSQSQETGDSSASGTSASTLSTETVPRHITLDGQSNFRDLGGYQTSDDRRVKFGQVYRSGELPRLSDQDVAELKRLGIRTVVNLLTEAEVERKGTDRVPEGTQCISLPMKSGNMGDLAGMVLEARKTGDFSKVPPDLNPRLHRMLITEGSDDYAKLLRLISDPKNRPIVFHCSHGVHRTGTATAILLSTLGVNWEDVRDDYLASNRFRKDEIDHRVQELKELDAANRKVPVDEVDSTNLEAFYVLDGSYIDAALDEATKQHGSMARYVREGLKLSDEEIGRLREQLLEPRPK